MKLNITKENIVSTLKEKDFSFQNMIKFLVQVFDVKSIMFWNLFINYFRQSQKESCKNQQNDWFSE
jgi:hypothetical protein